MMALPNNAHSQQHSRILIWTHDDIFPPNTCMPVLSVVLPCDTIPGGVIFIWLREVRSGPNPPGVENGQSSSTKPRTKSRLESWSAIGSWTTSLASCWFKPSIQRTIRSFGSSSIYLYHHIRASVRTRMVRCRILLPRDDQHSLSYSNIVWLPFVGIGTVLVQVTRLPLLWNQLST